MTFSWCSLGSPAKERAQSFPSLEGRELGKRNTSSACYPQRQTNRKHRTTFFNCSVGLNHFAKTPPSIPPFRRIAMRPPIRTIIKCHLGTNNWGSQHYLSWWQRGRDEVTQFSFWSGMPAGHYTPVNLMHQRIYSHYKLKMWKEDKVAIYWLYDGLWGFSLRAAIP